MEGLFLFMAAVALMSFAFVLLIWVAQVVGFFLRRRDPDHWLIDYIDSL